MSGDHRFTMTDDYVIQDGNIPGMMLDGSTIVTDQLQFDACTLQFRPGDSKTTAGEDANFQ